MPRLILALLRHGAYHQPRDVPSAHLPHSLTSEGRAQAARAAAEIARRARREGWQLHTVLDTSPLLRAWETASVMASALENLVGSPFRVEPYATLMERSLGSAANLTVAEIEDVLRSDPRLGEPPAKWREDSQFRLPLPGAESLLEAGERVARHLAERIVPLAGSERVDTLKILVGHGGSVRHAAVRLGLLTPEQVADLSMHYCAPIYWERLEGGWVHLDGEWKKRTPPPTEGLEDE